MASPTPSPAPAASMHRLGGAFPAAAVLLCWACADPVPEATRAASALEIPGTIPVEMADGTVEWMDLEEYLKGVVPREMSPSFPAAALEAQAVAARSYAVDYVRNGRAICTTARCQAWGETRHAETDAAVEATRGVVATFGGAVIPVFFSASCGGRTADNEDVWGGAPLPWLRGVPCIENRTGACEATCTPDRPSDDTCWGVNGHRLGMCQRGAQAMAACGASRDDILAHYLSGVVLAGPEGPAVPEGDGDGPGGEDVPAADAAGDLPERDEPAGDGTAGDGDAAADPGPGDGGPGDGGPGDAAGEDPGDDPGEDESFGCTAGARGRGGWIAAALLALLALGRRALPPSPLSGRLGRR